MRRIEKRKEEHIDICLNENVRADHNYWDDVNLIHKAVPEINKSKISLETKIFGKTLSAPIIIAAMSGGHSKGCLLNENCAKAAAELGVGFSVGSQRAFLENKRTAKTYGDIKEYDIPLVFANIGASQIINQKGKPALTIEEIHKAVEMIDADILTIHLNYPQEMVQPEGDENSEGLLKAVENLSGSFQIIAKECSFGISKEVAEKLKAAGVKGIETSGVSGTSWTAVEYYRAKSAGNKIKQRIGKTFWNWGIPAPISILEAKETGIPLIGSGGIKNGLDAARAIALGTEAVSMAGHLLPYAVKGSKALVNELEFISEELKTAMFLTGSRNVPDLKKARLVLTGKTKEWLDSGKD